MDGRVLRGEANRQAIVDALLTLVTEQGSIPASHEIARRAGVAKRSVFHHFPDMEALMVAAAETQLSKHWHVLNVPISGSLLERARQAVDQRAELFEGIAGVRRVAVLHEHESAELSKRLVYSRKMLRQHLRDSLQPEFSELEKSGADGALAACSWETWEVLRVHQKVSVNAAKEAVLSVIEGAFERALAAKG